MSVAIHQSKQSASTPQHNIAVYCAEGKYRLLLMLYFFFHVEIVSLTTTVLRRVLELKYRRHSMYGRSWYSTVASKENNGRKAADHTIHRRPTNPSWEKIDDPERNPALQLQTRRTKRDLFFLSATAPIREPRKGWHFPATPTKASHLPSLSTNYTTPSFFLSQLLHSHHESDRIVCDPGAESPRILIGRLPTGASDGSCVLLTLGRRRFGIARQAQGLH